VGGTIEASLSHKERRDAYGNKWIRVVWGGAEMVVENIIKHYQEALDISIIYPIDGARTCTASGAGA